MLIKRIITALILAILVGLAVFLLGNEYFSLALAGFALLAGWEWADLAGLQSPTKKCLFLLLMVLPMAGIIFWTQLLEIIAQLFDWTDVRSYSGILEWLVIAPVLFWIVIMFIIRKTPEGILKWGLKTSHKLVIGGFIILSAWMFLCRLKSFYSSETTMYFLLLIWTADVAAYFVGKRYGKRKLASEISPGKTLEGVYGALVAGVLCSIILSLSYGFPFMVAADMVLLSVLTVLISIYGDLYFSVIKRQRGVKDSGSLLPGHGGILDRIDSVVAAAPFFYAGIFLIFRGVT